eukprot:scaffold2726_cov167-Amphora_coffeaeformis.AAC.2
MEKKETRMMAETCVLRKVSGGTNLEKHVWSDSMEKVAETLLSTMTNSNSSGGTTLVNPGDAKHSLTVDGVMASSAEEEKIEGILINEEEHLMAHDEEISSVEDGDHDTEERKMLTVALVKSVVETKQESSSDEKRYGLRKRRRPTGEDLRVLEHNQSSKDGGLARSPKSGPDRMDAAIYDPLSKGDPPTAEPAKGGGTLVEGDVNLRAGMPSVAARDPEIAAPAPLVAKQSIPHPGPKVNMGDSKPSAVGRVKSEPLRPPHAQLKRPAAPLKTASPVNVPFISASSTVPNPLSAVPIQASTMSMHSSKAAHAEVTSSTVPCPLPAAAIEEKIEPAIPDSADKRRVTINEPLSRPRAFSIDLDLGQFDITGDSSGDPDMPLSGGGRNRAFSFECFAFGINADEPLPPLEGQDTDSISTGRPRGDSIIFDPSSFQDGGIHEKNALEKACLNEARKETAPPEPPTADVPVSQSSAPVAAVTPVHPPAGIKSNILPVASSNPTASTHHLNQIHPPAPVTSYTTTTKSANITTTTTTMLPPAAAAASTTTFSMDLLNKDGRIGIYLPEARKARIARFHEKRARRIWRKRIKYDCRKKLADSRPRIKGRFVKRSDMDED